MRVAALLAAASTARLNIDGTGLERCAEIIKSKELKDDFSFILTLSRHRRWHVHCADMAGGHFEYRRANTRAMDIPYAMPRRL